MSDEPEFKQDPMMPPGWVVWSTGTLTGDRDWHARPPGRPIPANYIHGPTKTDVAGLAWQAHRQRASVPRLKF
jgi:hypothetical protein